MIQNSADDKIFEFNSRFLSKLKLIFIEVYIFKIKIGKFFYTHKSLYICCIEYQKTLFIQFLFRPSVYNDEVFEIFIYSKKLPVNLYCLEIKSYILSISVLDFILQKERVVLRTL